MIETQAKLNEKHRTKQLKQLIDTFAKIDNYEKTDHLSIKIDKIKLEE